MVFTMEDGIFRCYVTFREGIIVALILWSNNTANLATHQISTKTFVFCREKFWSLVVYYLIYHIQTNVFIGRLDHFHQTWSLILYHYLLLFFSNSILRNVICSKFFEMLIVLIGQKSCYDHLEYTTQVRSNPKLSYLVYIEDYYTIHLDWGSFT